MTNVDILGYCEDPGAANFLADLAPAFTKRGLAFHLICDGLAKTLFAQGGTLKTAGDPITLLKQLKPRLVLVGTSENKCSPGLALIQAAKRAKIASVGVVDSPTYANFRFRGLADHPLAYAPDNLFVSDGQTKNAFLDLGYPSRSIKVCGSPLWDKVRASAQYFSRLDWNRSRTRLFPGAKVGRRAVITPEVSRRRTHGHPGCGTKAELWARPTARSPQRLAAR